MESGVEVKTTDKNGRSLYPIRFASHNAYPFPLPCPIIRYLAGVSATDDHGRTDLHYAAQKSWKGSLALVKCLVEEAGLNVSATDDHKRTALHYAAQNSSLSVVKYLVEEAGANASTFDCCGNSPVHFADMQNGCDETTDCKLKEKYLRCIEELPESNFSPDGVLKQKESADLCL